MFKKLGRLFKNIFRAIGKFFKNLVKDPLKTILAIIATVISIVTLQVEFLPAIWGSMLATQVALGVVIAVTVVGLNIPWLTTALLIFNFAASIYTAFLGPSQQFLSFLGKYGLADIGVMMASPTYRLLSLGVSSFFAYSDLISIRDGVTLAEGAELAAEEIGSTVGGIVGGGISGLLGGLADSGLGGMLLLAVGGYVAVQFLSSDKGSSNNYYSPASSTQI